ncbi:MAG: glycoside hydrolase family 28 protein, partial [Muribaculaceae bacterium]|nr:glycoside hydrolase family 28 protein [Muribaculaceae bacterium]
MKIQSTILTFCLSLTLLFTSCGGSSGLYYDITDYGARAVEGTDNARAIQQAIDACADAGGGTVLVPAGKTFMTGPLHLRSNVELRLAPGSRLLANPDEAIYTESAFGENRGEGMMWISGTGLENISITGTGTLDGNGVAFMGAELADSYELKPVTTFDPRPHVLTLID